MDDRKIIYLDDAINTMRQHSHCDYFEKWVIDESVAMKALKDLPSAQPERKVGKWIKKMQITETAKWSSYNPRWYCSYCHTEYDPAIANEINFCWNCGARMEGDGDEAD